MKVAVFGLGYVGTVTAAGLAPRSRGRRRRRRRARGEVTRGESPVVEPGIDELMAQGVHEGRLRATTTSSERSTVPTSR